jgi:hypothetical protein
MELPSILRDLKRIFIEDTHTDDSRPTAEIFLKWNHLRTDGSTLFFIRHYHFTFEDNAGRFMLSVLQSTHDKSMHVDIRNAVHKHTNDVIVSVNKTFFENERVKVQTLLDWIENAYDRASIEDSTSK